MRASLSFEQAPPISVPLRFFLTAPLFGIAAGLLLVATGGAVFASRWQGSALALTHLMTVGLMLMNMCGALLQVLPVAAGANVWRPRLTAWVTHLGVTAGAVLLAAGLLSGSGVLLQVAGPLLGSVLGFYVAVVLTGLLRTPARGATVLALRLAVGGLTVTTGFGVLLAAAFGWPLQLPLPMLASLHAAWGLLGWSLMLVAAVAYLVVPMFQLTPPYRPGFARWWAVGLAALCLAWSMLAFAAPNSGLATAVGLALAGLSAAFGATTLRLQQQRRRRIGDATLLFWRIAMVSLIAAAMLGGVRLFMPLGTAAAAIEFLIGVLMIGGTFTAVINGMLYKIVPFISWLHLQRVLPVPPNMYQMIPERMMRGQLRLYLAALCLLLAGVLLPSLTRLAGLLFAASCVWLEWNLVRAVRLYHGLAKGSVSAIQVAAQS